jgi:hypothetical protein
MFSKNHTFISNLSPFLILWIKNISAFIKKSAFCDSYELAFSLLLFTIEDEAILSTQAFFSCF